MEKRPTEQQLNSVVSVLQDELLRDWDTATIANGIKGVRTNNIGIVSEVFVTPGLYARLCHYHYGNRRRKPFEVNGFRVSMCQQGE